MKKIILFTVALWCFLGFIPSSLSAEDSPSAILIASSQKIYDQTKKILQNYFSLSQSPLDIDYDNALITTVEGDSLPLKSAFVKNDISCSSLQNILSKQYSEEILVAVWAEETKRGYNANWGLTEIEVNVIVAFFDLPTGRSLQISEETSHSSAMDAEKAFLDAVGAKLVKNLPKISEAIKEKLKAKVPLATRIVLQINEMSENEFLNTGQGLINLVKTVKKIQRGQTSILEVI